MRRFAMIRRVSQFCLFLFVGMLISVPQTSLFAQTINAGTDFTYQGYLEQGGSPVTGTCNFEFSLFDDPAAGSQIGSTQTLTGISVNNGVFSAALDFGEVAFNGIDHWLAMSADCDGMGYVPLTPRQAITPAPYALGMYGMYTQPNTTSPNVIGGYSGNSVAGVGATVSGGGSASSPNQALEDYATVGGGEGNAAQSPNTTIGGGGGNTAFFSYATVGGGQDNTASQMRATVSGGLSNTASGANSTVGGGNSNTADATNSTVGGGAFNQAIDPHATIGGGANNVASNNYAFIGGGLENGAAGQYAVIGGGELNSVSDGSFHAVISGGFTNTASANTSTIGGGQLNIASNGNATVGGGRENTASGGSSTVGGGWGNTATASYATIGGGQNNIASGQHATVAGGQNNTASGQRATVGGGWGNTAGGVGATVAGGILSDALGDYSFTVGFAADALHGYSFVWSGSDDGTSSFADGSFTARAPGGVRFYSTELGTTTGVQLLAGTGAWASLSDRNSKDNFQSIDTVSILNTLVNMPIGTWNYIEEAGDVRHIGPVAQDFYAAFNVGADDRYITTVDADGVALAAIQGLYQQTQTQFAVFAGIVALMGMGMMIMGAIIIRQNRRISSLSAA